MGKIQLLSADVANMIAAGEVVERPASVIKELVENAIDAKATYIEVRVKEAGKSYMSVTDNGVGMDKEDALLAFTRHATSKVVDMNDLFRISTLGFRGEALPSIASVSKITLQTSTGDVGTLVEIEDSQVVKVDACPSRVGTKIEVENLFYNTPARLKHLKSNYTELAAINEVMKKMVLSYPNISFSLYNEDKLVYTTSGRGELLENIALVEGINIAKNMIKVEGEDFDFNVSGYTSALGESRPNRYSIITILNGRSVRIPNVQNAIIEAYKTYLPPDRFPITILKIDSELSLVDVNVHPSKNEVRLSKENELKELVKKLILDALGKSFIAPSAVVRKEKEGTQESFKLEYDLSSRILEPKEEKVQVVVQEESVEYTAPTPVYTTEEVVIEHKVEDTSVVEESIKVEERKPVKHLKLHGQIHGTYIVGEDEEGMYLIDQHAAMERVNFEHFSKVLVENREMMDLLVPVVLELDVATSTELPRYLTILEDFGLFIEQFGINTYRINSIPMWMKDSDVKVFATEMIDSIVSSQKIDLASLRHHAISTLACKASLKANKVFSIMELEVLMDRLFMCDNPYTCPHGRPTIVKFTKYELERMFKRA
jgi:DNA mismatch repair protein MutL